MTESTANLTAAPAPATSSFWEDVLDIFYKPSAVFQRRQGRSAWPPMFFVAILLAVITVAAFNVMQPIFDAEFARNTAKAIQQNPQAAQAVERMRGFSMAMTKFIVGPAVLLSMFVLGVVTWLFGKLFGSTMGFGDSVQVAAWSYMPRVLGSIAGTVLALLSDPAKLTSPQSVSLSPARFLNPDTTNPILFQLAGRLDITILWETVLLAIGLAVIGRVAKGSAFAFGIVIWLLGALPVLLRSAIS